MPKPNDSSRSPVALDQDSTLIAIIEMSQSSGRVAATVPGLKRRPLKKPAPDPEAFGWRPARLAMPRIAAPCAPGRKPSESVSMGHYQRDLV